MKKQAFITLSLILLSVGFMGLFVSTPGNAKVTAVGITCDAEVRIGNLLSCKLTGLTSGSNYRVDAAHSDGNESRVLTAASTTEYVRFTFTTADSDGVVPVHLGDATTAGALTGGTDDTALVNLIDPADDIPSAFFQQLLSSVLIIGIFALLMTAFFIYRKRRV